MAHPQQFNFCSKVKNKLPKFFNNIKVLDIGSLDINGNNRVLFENCDYLGIDLSYGNNVDFVSVGHEFDGPSEYFDTIITTEALEHDIFYEKTIKNIIRMLKPGGLFLFTCATTGRPEHGTRRTTPQDSPFLHLISDDWADYYKNITEEDIINIDGFKYFFPDGIFEIGNENCDLYFYGIKHGNKYLKYML